MFVERDKDGAIKGVYAKRQPGYAEEELADNDPAVLAYRAGVDAILATPRDLGAELDALKAALVGRAVLLEADVSAEITSS